MNKSGRCCQLILCLGLIAFGAPSLFGQDPADDIAVLQQAIVRIRMQKARGRAFIEAREPNDPRPEVGVAGWLFNEMVFHRRGETASETRDWLNSSLREKIAAVDRVNELSDSQQQKLQLAGRGDLKRFFDRVEEQKLRFHGVKDDEIDDKIVKEMSREVRRLRDMLNSGLFEEDSLFGKAMKTTLTPGQLEKAEALRRIEQAGGRIGTQERGGRDVEEVYLSATDFADRDLRHFRNLTGLRRLELDSTQVTDSGLASLQGLRRLEVLDLGETKITDAGLLSVKRITSLTTIRLEGTQITDAGLVHLKSLTSLKSLDLSHARITDAGLEHVKKLTQLERLDLTGVSITDAGMTHLRALSSLRRLFLDDAPITDAGLLSLSELTTLERLDLYGTEVTDAGVARLERSLPSLTIFR